MFSISTTAVLIALAAPAQEPPLFGPYRGLTWIDDRPMEVPEEYARPGRGGVHVNFGGVYANERLDLLSARAGELKFLARRQIDVVHLTRFRQVVRVFEGTGPGCCGGGQLVPIREIASEPFELAPNVLINDVQPVSIPLLPGEYTVQISIEAWEGVDDRPVGWQSNASKTRRFRVF